MYTILHGDDEFSTSEQVHLFRRGMGDPQFADLNTMRLDGRKMSLSELKHACSAAPFLTEKRLVLVEGLLSNLEPRRKKGADSSEKDETGESVEENPGSAAVVQELREFLPRIPSTTELVFIEPRTLAKNNPILKLAEAAKSGAQVHESQPPKESELAGWVTRRAKKKGAQIDPDAAKEMANHIGADLRLLDNEIDKLATYCGDNPIQVQDVRTLVASVHEANIFQFVDAVGARRTSEAMRLLHEHLNRNAAPLYLLTMIVRQFRMLLQVKDLASRRMGGDAMAAQLRLNPFVVKKVLEQSGNFTIPQLEGIYRRLLETDLAMKTSRSDPTVALDVLVVDLTRR